MVYVPVATREPANGFREFSIEKIIDNSMTDFDLFVQVGEHLILYSGNGYKWERSELNGLLTGGYNRFWMHQSATSKADVYEKMSQLPVLDESLRPSERIIRLEQIGAAFAKYLQEGEITASCMRKGEQIATQLVECIREDRSCIKELSGLASHDQYTYLHSIRVAAYATSIAVQMGSDNDDHLRQIALGGIFHDVGKSNVPIHIIKKNGPLLESEWASMRQHPVMGFERINETMLHHVSRDIVLHHHERLNGSGYPHVLDKSSILTEVQIAAVADIYDALTSSRSYQNKRSRFEALDFIRHKLLRTEVSVDAFKALVECLAS